MFIVLVDCSLLYLYVCLLLLSIWAASIRTDAAWVCVSRMEEFRWSSKVSIFRTMAVCSLISAFFSFGRR